MAFIFHFKCTLKCRLQFCFNLNQSKILLSGNELTLYQMTKFKLFQTEVVGGKFSKMVENTIGQSISPFSAVFLNT